MTTEELPVKQRLAAKYARHVEREDAAAAYLAGFERAQLLYRDFASRILYPGRTVDAKILDALNRIGEK